MSGVELVEERDRRAAVADPRLVDEVAASSVDRSELLQLQRTDVWPAATGKPGNAASRLFSVSGAVGELVCSCRRC